MQESPLIIIGMHRSGTSLVTQTLQTCGVFMGARIDRHNESVFFKARNQHLFQLAHAEWDNPASMTYLLSNRDLRQRLITFLKRECDSLDALIYYWGLTRAWKFKPSTASNQLWGWKDPKNSYTLPIWLDIFPRAKVLHIYRNGIDVANSLKIREEKRKNKLYNPLLSCRCLKLKGAFDVWAEYVNACLTITNQLPEEQVLQICYEDFLNNPKVQLEIMAGFLNVRWSETAIAKATSDIKPTRAFAFFRSSELKQFYKNIRNHPVMKTLNYDQLVSD